MRIVVGADHAGFPQKARTVAFLESLGHEVEDVGTHSAEPVDFPDIARSVTSRVRDGRAERGVLVCGTGVGASIAANKTPGIRATVAHDTYTARQAVEHDDVNVACLGAWLIGPALIESVLQEFLAAQFSTDPDFRRRVEKLAMLEKETHDAREDG